MENKLNLTKIDAFTVYSSDNEISGSEKGLYRSSTVAFRESRGAGWYGSNGDVIAKNNIYQDESGYLYAIEYKGKFTDELKEYKENMKKNIKSKLTQEELEFLGINN